MKKRKGYIVLAVAGAIYILYNFIITSLIVADMPGENLSLWRTFMSELVVFIPVGVFFIAIQKLYKKQRWLFTSFTLKTATIHLVLLFLLIGIHAVWQVYFNSVFLGIEFASATIIRDAMGFLNLRVLIYIISIGLIVGIVKIQEKENRLLEQSELKLQLQKTSFRELELKLNPEIIDPNLNFIKHNVHSNPEKASNLVLALSNQLRILIDNLNEECIPLKKDLQFFEHYIQAVQLRLGKKLKVTTEVHDDLLQVKIPSLVLMIPFLEDIFFEKYKRFSGPVDHIIYKAHPLEQGFIQLALFFEPLKEGWALDEKLKDDRKLSEISTLIDASRGSSLQRGVKNNRLFVTLKLKVD